MQTAVNEQKGLVEGQKVDLGNDDVLSYLAEGSSIPFGVFVSLGTNKDGQVKLPGSAGDLGAKAVRGVALRTHTQVNGLAAGLTVAAEYAEKDMVSVLGKGRVAVKMETAFTPDDAVEVRYAGSGQLGAARVGNVGGETAPVSGVRIINSGQAGDIAILDLSL